MRTSGRGRSETLMFIAPAALLVGVYIWLTGEPLDAVAALDRLVLTGVNAVERFGSAVVEAIGRM